MQITDVRVRKITKEGKMKAVVSITLDDEFVVHDIKAVSYTHLMVAFWRRCLSFRQENSWDATKVLVISVPRSSMISRSQL